MELLCNDTGHTEEESTEDLVKQLGSYCGESVESMWAKELACEKHHGCNEGLRAFCLESVRCLWHVSLGKYILLILLISSSAMY